MPSRTSLLPCAALLAAAACTSGPAGNWRRMARPMTLGDDMPVEFSSQRKAFATAGYMELPGDGNLSLVAQAVNNQAKISLRLFERTGNLPVAEGASPLEVPNLRAGQYYLYVANDTPAIATRVNFRAVFKPADPDGKSGDDKDATGAREITGGRAAVGTVDYMNMNRTDHVKLPMPLGGSASVRVRFDGLRGKVATTAILPTGEEIAFDTKKPAEVKNVPPGDLVVRVQAEEGGFARYSVTAQVVDADPDGDSGENADRSGADELQLKPRQGANTQFAEARAEVNFDKRNATDWYRVQMPDKGKLSVQLRLKNPRAKVHAYFGRDDDVRRVQSGFNVDVAKDAYYVKVQAADQGEASGYTLTVEYYPAVYIDARVIEIDRKNGCAVLVDKGSNHMVRQGVAASVVVGGQTVVTGLVETVFANSSRVRVAGGDCKFSNASVQISGY